MVMPAAVSILTALALGASILSGCADGGSSGDARLDRLEARLDRLDERLTRAEGGLLAGGDAKRDDEARAMGLSYLENMDPKRRARLRNRLTDMRERMARLEEGADLNAEPGSPEFRRALVLEMLRRAARPGARGRASAADDPNGPDAAGDPDGGAPAAE